MKRRCCCGARGRRHLLRVVETDARERVEHLPLDAMRVAHRRALAVLDVDDVDVKARADLRRRRRKEGGREKK